ncbi:enoyl-CoA hydratase-related protein [Nocardia sp. NPDC005745]|uniref:enoyl-CoA hydratase-related protein n=1 Tax=Nocardia sp. NPDC005745 TaxID=3157061 RepID=UPI0033F44421
MDDLVLTDDPRPRVRRITLNRPAKRNAMSNALRSRLLEALREGDLDDDVSVIVIRGAGKCWSAGYDLAQDHSEPLSRHSNRRTGHWPRHIVDGWIDVWDYDTPVIGQVHGYCLAGGTELAMACDLVYVADDAIIGYPPVRDISPPDMCWQPWIYGLRRGMEAVLTGDSVSGKEAVELGFANRSFPVDELEEAVLTLAERISKVPPEVLALNKRAVHRAMDIMGIRTSLRATTDSQTIGGMLPSALARKEALRADVTSALTQRDSGFGDYRVGERRNGDEVS